MSSIFGVFSKHGNSIEQGILSKTMDKLGYWKPDESGIWMDDDLFLGQHTLRTTPESLHERLPFFESENQYCIVSDSRLDYREDIIRQICESWSPNDIITDSDIILRAYHKWGKECVKHLYGDFSFVIWDACNRQLFCARDHFGCRPLFYFNNQDYFAFSTEIKGLLNLPFVPNVLDDNWIVDSLLTIYPNKSTAPYKQISRLEPAHYIAIKSTSLEIKQFWELELNEKYSNLDEKEAALKLRKLLSKSVQNRVRTINDVGIELSGGLDSSSVTAIAKKYVPLLGKRIVAFTQILPSILQSTTYPFEDELLLSKKIVDTFKIDQHRLISGNESGVLDAIYRSLKILGYPSIEGYSVMSDSLFSTAKDSGVNVVLSGFGGDQGVTNQAKRYLNDLAREWKWRKLLKEISSGSKGQEKNIYKILIKKILIAKVPYISLIRKRHVLLGYYRKEKYDSLALNEVYEKCLEAKKRFKEFHKLKDQQSLLEKQRDNIQNNFLSQRIENTFLLAQSARLEYRYPFLDVKLIEFYHSLPSTLKYKNGVGRYIIRKAMEDILPSEICWRDDKSFATIPNVQVRFKIDIEAFNEIIQESSKKNKYHYVDYPKMHEMIGKIQSRDNKHNLKYQPNLFFNHMKVIVLQKWQREGKIDIGIKC